MKVAVCISGQTRKLPQSRVARLFSEVNPDYYIHTWDNEHNPHVPLLPAYFPNATIETERYEDVFDNIDVLSDLTTVEKRYSFAQFYTIAKSFQLCKQSNIEYDYIIRIRTDITFPKASWAVQSDPTAHNGLIQELNDTRFYHLVNCSYFEDIHEARRTLNTTSNFPYVASYIGSVINNKTFFSDYYWVMNSLALDRLTSLTPVETVQSARQFKTMRMHSEGSFHEVEKSPVAWQGIFTSLGIPLISSPIARGSITRNPTPNYVPGHGDIT